MCVCVGNHKSRQWELGSDDSTALAYFSPWVSRFLHVLCFSIINSIDRKNTFLCQSKYSACNRFSRRFQAEEEEEEYKRFSIIVIVVIIGRKREVDEQNQKQ
jgi:hypothetical protein